MQSRRSLYRIAMFASLMAILDAAPGLPQLSSGVWYGWTFVVEPLIGVFLNPSEAFYSAFIGVMAGHVIGFRGDLYEFIFALGAPLGASVTSLVLRGRLIPIVGYYVFALLAYFTSPSASTLPFWALWDTYVAFFLLLVVVLIGRRRFQRTKRTYVLSLSALIGLEADILLRIFIFVPVGTYKWLYGFSIEFVQAVWAVSAFVTPIQVTIASLVTVVVGRIIGSTVDVLKENAP